ncbi:MAG: hypothetical protein M3Y58_08635 [Chloroflexota bacterium]|nr:hypothetical protein [Chloroflexota bacterium]
MVGFLLDHNVSAKLAPLLHLQGHTAIIAWEIKVLIAPGIIMHNALYEWQSRDGWQRRPLPPD